MNSHQLEHLAAYTILGAMAAGTITFTALMAWFVAVDKWEARNRRRVEIVARRVSDRDVIGRLAATTVVPDAAVRAMVADVLRKQDAS